MSLRRTAAVVRDEGFPSAGRRTLRPSTAVRAVRFRGTGKEYRGLNVEEPMVPPRAPSFRALPVDASRVSQANDSRSGRGG
jgi:hypothetical protein